MNKRLQKLLAEHPIGMGNFCTDVQFSNFIRPQGETSCNGFTFPPGQLRNFDLKPFEHHFRFAVHLARQYPDLTTVLYVWRTPYVVYGASITTAQGELLSHVFLRGPKFVETVLELERLAGIVYQTARTAA